MEQEEAVSKEKQPWVMGVDSGKLQNNSDHVMIILNNAYL
jgi:hypothetical protein